MHVIGLFAQARNGKNLLGEHLCGKLNEMDNIQWQMAAFAANVKKIYCETFDVDMEFVEKWKVITTPPFGFDMSVRQGLQFIGDGFRKIKKDIWVDLLFRNRSPMIITDGRYPGNEALRVRKEGGCNILIIRPDMLNDDPDGSEAIIKPYAEFGLKHFKDCCDVKTELFRLAAVEAMGGGVQSQPPEHMELFDFFIKNDGSKEDFIEKVDKKVIPFVQEFFRKKGN